MDVSRSANSLFSRAFDCESRMGGVGKVRRMSASQPSSGAELLSLNVAEQLTPSGEGVVFRPAEHSLKRVRTRLKIVRRRKYQIDG